MIDFCYFGLLVAVIVFLISLFVFFDRISRHATEGNGFYDYNRNYDYNQTLILSQRPWEDAGTPVRPWMMDHETNKQCPPAYCSP
jgi:hypothetical protein